MGLGFIFAGFVFLFNPLYNVFDIMPDFVGYVLIMLGLMKLRDLAPAFATARRFFLYLAWTSFAKLFAVYVIITMSDEGFIMLFTFIFTLIEVGLMYIAFREFFDGFLLAATLYDGESVVKEIGRAKTVSIIFVILHNLLTFLPELSYLMIDEAVEGYILAPYKGAFVLMAFILSLAMGIVWLIYMRRFIKTVKADGIFLENAEKHYVSEVLPKTDMFLMRRHKTAFTLWGAGCIFLCDIYIDGFDILPDYVAAVLFAVGCVYIRDYIKNGRLAIILSVVLGITGGTDWIYNINFSGKYYSYGVLHNDTGYNMFLISMASSVITALSALAVMLTVFSLCVGCAKNYTGRENREGFAGVEKKNSYIRSYLNRAIITALVFGCLLTVSSVLMSYFNYYEAEDAFIYVMYGNLAVSALWIFFSTSCFGKIIFQMEEKFVSY